MSHNLTMVFSIFYFNIWKSCHCFCVVLAKCISLSASSNHKGHKVPYYVFQVVTSVVILVLWRPLSVPFLFFLENSDTYHVSSFRLEHQGMMMGPHDPALHRHKQIKQQTVEIWSQIKHDDRDRQTCRQKIKALHSKELFKSDLCNGAAPQIRSGQ